MTSEYSVYLVIKIKLRVTNDRVTSKVPLLCTLYIWFYNIALMESIYNSPS